MPLITLSFLSLVRRIEEKRWVMSHNTIQAVDNLLGERNEMTGLNDYKVIFKK